MHRRLLPSAIVTAMLCAVMTFPASAACDGAATVDGSTVNFRAAADTGSAVKAVTADGAPVVLESKVGSDWYEVIYNGTSGLIAAQYLKCADALNADFGTAYVNGAGVRLRSSPATSSAILGTYDTGLALSVTGVSGTWYKVTVNGTSGYMSGDYVSFAKPDTSSVPAVSAGQLIVNTAMEYLGYSYVYGGTTPSGFDCSGFVKYVYGLNGYTLDRTAAAQSADGASVDTADLQPGDILCFSTGGYIGHVGIYIGDGKFIHAAGSTTGIITTDLNSTSYIDRLVECRRIV